MFNFEAINLVQSMWVSQDLVVVSCVWHNALREWNGWTLFTKLMFTHYSFIFVTQCQGKHEPAITNTKWVMCQIANLTIANYLSTPTTPHIRRYFTPFTNITIIITTIPTTLIVIESTIMMVNTIIIIINCASDITLIQGTSCAMVNICMLKNKKPFIILRKRQFYA